MKQFGNILLILLTVNAGAQQRITGRVTDDKQVPVIFANIFLEGSYDGCTTDTSGVFELLTSLSGKQILVASFIGYEKQEINIELLAGNSPDPIMITLSETSSELNEVVITAGVFSASDKKSSATLSSFDIASTASAVGDIYGAYSTMPGSQKVGHPDPRSSLQELRRTAEQKEGEQARVKGSFGSSSLFGSLIYGFGIKLLNLLQYIKHEINAGSTPINTLCKYL